MGTLTEVAEPKTVSGAGLASDAAQAGSIVTLEALTVAGSDLELEATFTGDGFESIAFCRMDCRRSRTTLWHG